MDQYQKIADQCRKIAQFIHQCWVSFQLGAGQTFCVEPDDEDLRSNLASFFDFLEHPDRTPEQSHELWMADRIAHGWVCGPVKDKVAKTHPDLVPYTQLPSVERAKDENHILSLRLAKKLFWDEVRG